MEKRKLNTDGTVDVITTMPRYVVNKNDSNFLINDYCDDTITDIKSNCKFFINIRSDRDGYRGLNNVEIDEEDLPGTKEQDFEAFKKVVGDEYDCYYLVAYNHSTISFSANHTGVGSCPWDSGCIGFVAIPKNDSYLSIDKAMQLLTDCWNGFVESYEIYDNLEQMNVDEYVLPYSEDKQDYFTQWMENCIKKYNLKQEDFKL